MPYEFLSPQRPQFHLPWCFTPKTGAPWGWRHWDVFPLPRFSLSGISITGRVNTASDLQRWASWSSGSWERDLRQEREGGAGFEAGGIQPRGGSTFSAEKKIKGHPFSQVRRLDSAPDRSLGRPSAPRACSGPARPRLRPASLLLLHPYTTHPSQSQSWRRRPAAPPVGTRPWAHRVRARTRQTRPRAASAGGSPRPHPRSPGMAATLISGI